MELLWLQVIGGAATDPMIYHLGQMKRQDESSLLPCCYGDSTETGRNDLLMVSAWHGQEERAMVELILVSEGMTKIHSKGRSIKGLSFLVGWLHMCHRWTGEECTVTSVKVDR